MNRIFIIAEAGVNHNGSLDMAFKLAEVAREAGADAVKFQTFKTEALATKSVDKADYQKENLKAGGNQFEMLRSLELSEDNLKRLAAHCCAIGIQFLSTPFDEESARFLLETLEIPIVKVPSGETVNHPYLKFLSSYHRPMLLSTGMCDMQEVTNAVNVIREDCRDLTLLHCTTNYPCPMENVNLRAMLTLKESFGLPVGYSDHTMGIEVSIAAAAMGAQVIEKHFTLDRCMQGPDHACSLQPDELKAMVTSIRNVEKALGDGVKRPTMTEEKIKKLVRKSVVINEAKEKGAVLKREDLGLKRSGGDILPQYIPDLVGRVLKKNKSADTALFWDDLQ